MPTRRSDEEDLAVTGDLVKWQRTLMQGPMALEQASEP